MLYNKEETLAMAKPAIEVLSAKLPNPLFSWSDIESLRAFAGVEGERNIEPETPEDLEEFEQSITFRDGHTLTLLIIRPKVMPAGGCPLLAWYHGGGWIAGSYYQGRPMVRRIVSAHGVVAVLLPTRLAPEHPFPKPQFDAYDGLQWCVKNAATLQANPEKGFIIGGSSAGAQLTSVCAQHWVDERKTPPLTGMALSIAWILGPSQVPKKYREHYNSPTQKELERAPLLCTTDLDIIDRFLSPDHKSDWSSVFMAKNPHVGMPRTYFSVMGMDPLRDHSFVYEDALRKAGVKTKLDVYPGVFHAFEGILPNAPQTKKLAEDQKKGFAFLLSRNENVKQQSSL